MSPKKLINMTKSFYIPVLAAIMTFSAACNNASNDSKTAGTAEKQETVFDLAAAKTAIEAENTKFMEAFKKGDSAAVASNYAQDALVMPPNAEPVAKSGNAALWGSFIRMGVKDVKLVTDDIAGNAEIIAETGRYEIYAAENKLLDKGKYVVVWKPENGAWKMYRDIFNTNMPAAPVK